MWVIESLPERLQLDDRANMALVLEDIGWGTAEHWMRLQTSYELAQTRRDRTAAERRADALQA